MLGRACLWVVLLGAWGWGVWVCVCMNVHCRHAYTTHTCATARRSSIDRPHPHTIANPAPKQNRQGLVFEPDGTFLEGTGLYGQSTLRRVDGKTGETLKSVPLDQRFFGMWVGGG